MQLHLVRHHLPFASTCAAGAAALNAALYLNGGCARDWLRLCPKPETVTFIVLDGATAASAGGAVGGACRACDMHVCYVCSCSFAVRTDKYIACILLYCIAHSCCTVNSVFWSAMVDGGPLARRPRPPPATATRATIIELFSHDYYYVKIYMRGLQHRINITVLKYIVSINIIKI